MTSRALPRTAVIGPGSSNAAPTIPTCSSNPPGASGSKKTSAGDADRRGHLRGDLLMNTEASASGPRHFTSVASGRFQRGCKLFARRPEKPRLYVRQAGP